jgi:hypothetical protein
MAPCNNHPQPRTLKTKHITENHIIIPRTPTNLPNPSPPQQPPLTQPPNNITSNPSKYPIHTITEHKLNIRKDKYKITNEYNTYKCQWILPNNIIYNKWIPQRELFPINQPLVTTHNLNTTKKLLHEATTQPLQKHRKHTPQSNTK